MLFYQIFKVDEILLHFLEFISDKFSVKSKLVRSVIFSFMFLNNQKYVFSKKIAI